LPPPYGGFISTANAQNRGQDAKAQEAWVAKRASVLLDKKNAKFTLEELIEDINSGKRNGLLKKLVGDPVSASRFYYRTPTPFELKLIEADPDSPIARLHQYVVLEYVDNAAREAAIEPIKRDKSFLHVARDAVTTSSALPTEATTNPTWLDTSAKVGKQWGMHKLGFAETPASGTAPVKPGGWDKSRGRAFVGIVDNGIETVHPDLVKNFRRHLSINYFTKTYFDEPDELITPYASDPVTGRALAGHGTHVASTIAASHNDGGTAGGCPECSLMIVREYGSLIAQSTAIARAVDTGVQVLNMSFESRPADQYDCAGANALYVLCLVLTHASNHGVSAVAAAGNQGNIVDVTTSTVPHAELWNVPAVHPSVLAVSGLQFDGTNISFWAGAAGAGSTSGYFGSNFGAVTNGVPQISFAAPAKDILASVYRDRTWNGICGDTANAPNASVTTPNTDGVGLCTGTSMAAPHISAMAGLVKSANPLLDTAGVKSVLIQAAECLEGSTSAPCTATTPLNGVAGDAMKKLGYGVPKADKAVQIALGGPSAKNRLTPLFGYYNLDGDNHFYTTNPQMAIAAKRNTLQPAPKYKILPSTFNCATAGVCDFFAPSSPKISLLTAISVVKPNGNPCTSAESCAGQVVFAFANSGARGSATPVATNAGVLNVANGYLQTGLTSSDPNIVLRALPISTFPLTYQEIGVTIPGYPNLPCGSKYTLDATTGSASNGACQYFPARAIASLLTTHVDPTNSGKTLVPV
jgi:subtilisin family serine protease